MANNASQLEFQHVRTRRVFEEICEQIRQRLASGALRPGDKLPAERELALLFHVSRPAVREALRTLEISGVVSLQKGVKGGAFIRDGNPALVTQSLQDLVFLGRVSMRSLAEARVLILGVVIKLACERATEEDFQKIDEVIDYIEGIDDLAFRAEVTMKYFHLIAQSTRNEVLTMLVDSLGDIVRYVVDKIGRKSRPELVATRRRILKAMRARDVNAASKALNEFLAAVHEQIDVEAVPLEQPGRVPVLPVGTAAKAPARKVAASKAAPARVVSAKAASSKANFGKPAPAKVPARTPARKVARRLSA